MEVKKKRNKFGRHGRCKNMPRSLQPSIIFSSFTWKAFICTASLSWLFSLVAYSLVQFILDIHWIFLTSFLSSELIVPYRYQERAASSGRREYLKQLTGGSQEPGLPAYVTSQNSVPEYSWWCERIYKKQDWSGVQIPVIWKVSLCSPLQPLWQALQWL